MYTVLHVKHRLYLSDFSETNFLDGLSKNTNISNFMKIRPLGAELFHGIGRTDMTKLLFPFAILRTRLKMFVRYSYSATPR
jgi:hypothetical protein